MELKNQLVQQALIVPQDTMGPGKPYIRLSLFDENGTAFSPAGNLDNGFPIKFPNASPTAAEQHAAFSSACVAASAFGAKVIIPQTGVKVVGGFSMSGYSCSLVGYGYSTVSSSSNYPMGSVIEVVNQTGPALNFTGFNPGHNFVGSLQFSGFAIKGDGTADSSTDTLSFDKVGAVLTLGGATKKGVYAPANTLQGVTFSNILITNCGGIHFDVIEMYLSQVTNLRVTDPIACVANNVPCVRMRGCNGTNVTGLGIRILGSAGSANIAAAGAVRLEASIGANYYWDRATFYGCWTENCWIPTNGSIVVSQTSGIIHNGWMHYDARKPTGATGTSCMRFEPSAVGGTVSGNLVTGVIPGSDHSATAFDYGIELAQSYNQVNGTKEYPGNNVQINSTIRESFIMLGGSRGSGSTTAAVTDNSGRQDNTIIDSTVGLWQLTAASGQTAMMTVAQQHIRQNRFTATQSVSATVTPDMTTGANIFEYTLGASPIGIGAPVDTNQRERELIIVLIEDATGGRTISSWSSVFAFKSGSSPTITTTANAVNWFHFRYIAGKWREM